MLTRRATLTGGLGAGLGTGLFAASPVLSAPTPVQALMGLQQSFKGVIGISARRVGAGKQNRLFTDPPDRFAMCSTFKWILAASILKGVDQGRLSLSQSLSFTEKDILGYAPVAKANLSKGALSVGELCAATVSVSDNTAANLLFPLIGGPKGLTAFVRGLGDTVTRFDRIEPDLNSNLKNDPRDTTTAIAMTDLLIKVFESDVLSSSGRDTLSGWMKATTTGNDRIRAGTPSGWIVGDKTGTGANGATNDVGFIHTPDGGRIYLSVFTSFGDADLAARQAAIAEATRICLSALT